MLLFSIDYVPGRELDALGLVKGQVVQSKHIGRDIMASLKNLVGGEINDYTEMLCEARNIATNRMLTEAQAMGAEAIVGVRFATSQITDAAAEVIAYGTAVRFR